LKQLTWQGAKRRYPDGVPPKVIELLRHELQLIEQLHYEAYFLTVWDLVVFARSRGILCQGRGSAANSAVCYCLEITAVDPRMDLLFERFISRERNEAPDIDVDFEHQRREEVLQYLYQKYGRERAGMAAAVITYRTRSAIREVGKALGLSLDRIDQLAKNMDGYPQQAIELGSSAARRWASTPTSEVGRRLIHLTRELIGFPRHLSQHVGGMVMTRGPLCELVPIENAAMADRTVVQWDKDDLEELGILKVDCLSLGMLTAIRKCFQLVRRDQRAATDAGQHPGGRSVRLRYDLPRGYDRRLPDRKPGADVHAAAVAAPLLLRSGDRGRHCPAGSDPGPDGPSLSAAAGRRGAGDVPQRPDPPRAGKDAGRAHFSGAGDEAGRGGRGIHAGRSGSIAAGHGSLAQERPHRNVSPEIAGRHAPARPVRRIRSARLSADPRVRRIRIPRVACRQFRLAGLRLGLSETPLPRRVRRRADQQPAHGLLRARPTDPRRTPARGRRAAGRCQSQRLGLYAGRSPDAASGVAVDPRLVTKRCRSDSACSP
jgi:hypothetical protein